VDGERLRQSRADINFWSQTTYALSISRRDSTRSITGRMPSSLDMAHNEDDYLATICIFDWLLAQK